MSTRLEISEWTGSTLTVGAFSEYAVAAQPAKQSGKDEPTPEPDGEATAS